MTSLFTRVFVSFWAAMALIVLSTIGVTVAVAWSRFVSLTSFNAPDFVDSANRIVVRKGDQGLRVWLEAVVSEHDDLAIYLLDGRGNDMLARTVPPRLRTGTPSPGSSDVGQQPSLTSGIVAALGFMRPRNHVLVSTPLTGGRWRLIAAWYGASPIDVLGSAPVWATLVTLALGVSGAMCWLIARHVSHPVVALQASARRLADGYLDERLGRSLTHRRDELGLLASEFNMMAERLKAQMDSKEMLLRDISHELRSPLTRLRMAAALAQQRPSDVELYLERIERDISRLDRLIDDTLRFSWVATPGFQMSVEPVDLVALVADTIADADIEAAPRGIAILLSAPDILIADCNPDLLRRVIDNVLRNAIRFSPPDGPIDVRLGQAGPHIVLTIADQGPGVPAHALERIFEAFFRVEEARERRSGGAGLGLALAARIAALHRGHMVARNRQPRGLEIELCLLSDIDR